MNIAFLTSRLPYPSRSGDQLRAAHMIRHLAREHSVTLYSAMSPASSAHSAYLEPGELPDIAILGFHYTRLQAAGNVIQGLLSKEPVQAHLYKVPTLINDLRMTLQDNMFDVVIAQMVRTTEWIPRDCTVPVIVDLVDLLSCNYAAPPASAPWYWKQAYSFEQPRLVKYEREVTQRAGHVLLTSARECEALRETTWAKNVVHVPNGVESPELPVTQQNLAGRILFFGTLDYPPNTETAVHLARDLFPFIKQRVPEAELVIAGWDPPSAIRSLANGSVKILPNVHVMQSEILRSTVTAVPMRYGAGLQNKILESMANGVPVVAYANCAEAFGEQPPPGLVVAANEELFVNEVIKLLTNPARRAELSAAARKSVESAHSWEAALRPLDSILSDIAKSVPARVEKVQ